MSSNSPSGVTRFVANTTNFVSGPFYEACKAFGYSLAPAGLGAIGGRLTGCGWRMGLVQAVVGSLLHRTCIGPLGGVVSRNTGNEPVQFNESSVAMLTILGLVVQVAAPIFITKRCGGKILTGAGAYFPLLLPGDTTNYTWRRALLNNIAPTAAEFTISALRTIDS